jgi:hypothetical protein
MIPNRLVRTLLLSWAAVAALAGAARAEKPEKIPVAIGDWKGPSASTFKSAVKSGIAKDCKIVGKKTARVIVDGEVTPDGKGFQVRVIVKAAKSGEVAESHSFPFAKAKASKGQSAKMGKMVTEAARRAPTE